LLSTLTLEVLIDPAKVTYSVPALESMRPELASPVDTVNPEVIWEVIGFLKFPTLKEIVVPAEIVVVKGLLRVNV
jgi:hypothetical protein